MKPDWQNNYFLILFAAAILHGIFLSLIILFRSRKENGLVWLSVALIGISSLLINYFLFISDAIAEHPHWLGVFVPLIYLTGPAFYFFVRQSVNKTIRFKWYDTLHLIPIIIASIESLRTLMLSAEVKLAFISGIFNQKAPSVLEMILSNRFIFVTAGYVLAGIYYLSMHAPSRPLKRIVALKRFSISFLVLLVTSVVIQITYILLALNGAYLELTLTFVYAISIHILGYLILSNERISPWSTDPEKYLTSPLDLQLLKRYRQKLVDHLETQKPWLSPEFSITDLSNQLHMPRHHISQVLNEEMKISFNDLINSYRIQEVKTRLVTGDLAKYSIFGIAKDCGFASKSTFNRIFKKYTGTTPTAYSPQSSPSKKVSTIST